MPHQLFATVTCSSVATAPPPAAPASCSAATTRAKSARGKTALRAKDHAAESMTSPKKAGISSEMSAGVGGRE
jgi:hypothetical protein